MRPIHADTRRWLAEIDRLSVAPPPPVPPTPPLPPKPRVGGRLGASLVATSNGINGNLSMDGGEGDADLQIPLSGPKGRMKVEVVATRHGGRWTLNSLEVE